MNISYSEFSYDYDKVRSKSNCILTAIKNHLSLEFENVHVDLGCGTCKETESISKNFKKFIGIDFSAEMISIAKKKIPTGEFIEYDMQKGIPLKENSSNSISTISFYHHMDDKRFFFSEVFRVLEKEGIFLLITNSIEQLALRGYYKYFPNAIKINKRRFMETKKLEDLLTNIGFSMITSEPLIGPDNFYGKELVERIQSTAFDSVFNLISKDEYLDGIKSIEDYFDTNSKLESCRDRYLLVCKK